MTEADGHARGAREDEVAEANRAISRPEEEGDTPAAPPEREGSAGGWFGRIRRAFALLGRSAD